MFFKYHVVSHRGSSCLQNKYFVNMLLVMKHVSIITLSVAASTITGLPRRNQTFNWPIFLGVNAGKKSKTLIIASPKISSVDLLSDRKRGHMCASRHISSNFTAEWPFCVVPSWPDRIGVSLSNTHNSHMCLIKNIANKERLLADINHSHSALSLYNGNSWIYYRLCGRE